MSSEVQHNYIYVPFRPGDTVRCTRHYEKEKAYLTKTKLNPSPIFGKTYMVSEVTIGYNGEVWLGLYGIGDGKAGWSAKSFELKSTGAKKKEKDKEKEKGRMIRI